MVAYSFQLRTFPSQPQRQGVGDSFVLRLALLLFGTFCWLSIYFLLTQRLWQGASLTESLTLSMISVIIPLGVILIVAWWQLRRAWRLGNTFHGWPALTLDELLLLSPSQFEEYVTQRIFVRRGFNAVNTPDVKDGGIDILLTDRFNQNAVVQCKRYRNVVGEETVRDLYGTMLHGKAVHAYLVTTARISQPARNWAADKNIELIDGERLVALGK